MALAEPLAQRLVAERVAVEERGRAVALDRGPRAVGQILDRQAFRRRNAAGKRDRAHGPSLERVLDGCRSRLGLVRAAAERDPDRGGPRPGGNERKGRLEHPHSGIAEALPHLQADERGEREADRSHRAERAHVGAAKVGRRQPATAVCEVGTQSISPITNRNRISITTGSASFTASSRNGNPISGSPIASFAAAGTEATRSVSRNWKNVTRKGLTITRKPQVELE